MISSMINTSTNSDKTPDYSPFEAFGKQSMKLEVKFQNIFFLIFVEIKYSEFNSTSSLSDENKIHKNIIRAEQISEKNRKTLESELKFCQKNKILFESKKQSFMKDPSLLLSQISEKMNEEAIRIFQNNTFNEENNDKEAPRNSPFIDNQINSLIEIVKYDHIPIFHKEMLDFHDEGSQKELNKNGGLISERDSKEIKENRITLPFQVYEFDEEKRNF